MKIVVIGTGPVGLVTGACLTEIGHHVVCVDSQANRIETIKDGRSPVQEPELETVLRSALKANRLTASTDLPQAVAGADVIMIAVEAPVCGTEIDLSQITAAATAIGRAMGGVDKYQVVAVKSTVLPGTTEGQVRWHIEQALGKTLPAFGLCMNPDFLRAGTAVADFRQSDRIVLGCIDPHTETVMRELYRDLPGPVLVTTPRNAEMIKCAANALMATLESFGNEIAALCENQPGLDADQVMDGVRLDRRLAAGAKNVPCDATALFRAGIGFGGGVLKDVNALRAYAKQNKVATPLLDGVIKVNDTRCDQVMAIVTRVVGSLSGKSIAVLGLASHPSDADGGDSPVFALVQSLLTADVRLRGFDPVAGKAALAALGTKIEIVETIDAALHGVDAVVIATASSEIRALDWKTLTAGMAAPVIIDAANCLRGVALPEAVRYHPIGVAPPPASAKAASIEHRVPPKADTPVPKFLRRA